MIKKQKWTDYDRERRIINISKHYADSIIEIAEHYKVTENEAIEIVFDFYEQKHWLEEVK